MITLSLRHALGGNQVELADIGADSFEVCPGGHGPDYAPHSGGGSPSGVPSERSQTSMALCEITRPEATSASAALRAAASVVVSLSSDEGWFRLYHGKILARLGAVFRLRSCRVFPAAPFSSRA
jgi:hypothetical protein